MTTTLQHTLELIGSNEDCYMVFLNCTEDECFQGAHENNAVDVCRYICNKRKYMAFVRGDMDAAAKWLETSLKYPGESWKNTAFAK